MPRITIAVLTLVVLAGCAMTEQEAYEHGVWEAEWMDKFSADRRACQQRGGHIVQERHRERRFGETDPEVGAPYYCAR